MLAPPRPHVTEYEIDWQALFAFVVVAIAVVVLVLVVRSARAAQKKREKDRWANLCRRFGPEIAGRIWRKLMWQGQTAEQLGEVLGPPLDVAEQVMKTKSRHVFKYRRTGRNRYGLKVTLENGIVVGWDEK